MPERNYKAYKKTLETASIGEQSDKSENIIPATTLAIEPYANYNKQLIQMREVKLRYKNGESLRRMASSVKLNRETVTKYLRLEEQPTKVSQKKFNFSGLTDHILDIIQKSEGITTKTLIDKLRAMGYNGGQTTAYKFIKENFNVRQGVTKRPLSRHSYFPAKAALLLSQSPTKLNAIEKEVVNNLCTAPPDIKHVLCHDNSGTY